MNPEGRDGRRMIEKRKGEEFSDLRCSRSMPAIKPRTDPYLFETVADGKKPRVTQVIELCGYCVRTCQIALLCRSCFPHTAPERSSAPQALGQCSSLVPLELL